MAEITRFQLNEIKRELWFQISRIDKDLALSVRRPPGMLKSKRRLLLLLTILNQLAQDGVLYLKDEEVSEDADGTSEGAHFEREVWIDSKRRS